MKSLQLLRCIFPDVLADYFDVVDIQESVTQFDFWLDERNFIAKVRQSSDNNKKVAHFSTTLSYLKFPITVSNLCILYTLWFF